MLKMDYSNEKEKEIMKKYQIDSIDFPTEEMLEIYKKYY